MCLHTGTISTMLRVAWLTNKSFMRTVCLLYGCINKFTHGDFVDKLGQSEDFNFRLIYTIKPVSPDLRLAPDAS